RAAHRCVPSAHRELADAQQERPLGEQGHLPREARGQERSAQTLDAAWIARELLLGEVDRIVGLEELTLPGRAPLDPPVDLRADPRGGAPEAPHRPGAPPPETPGGPGGVGAPAPAAPG